MHEGNPGEIWNNSVKFAAGCGELQSDCEKYKINFPETTEMFDARGKSEKTVKNLKKYEKNLETSDKILEKPAEIIVKSFFFSTQRKTLKQFWALKNCSENLKNVLRNFLENFGNYKNFRAFWGYFKKKLKKMLRILSN